MYKEEKNFTSDLMNSYAWDTAILYMQKFDDRENKTKPYSRQNSLNTGSLANKGTNQLTELVKQDKLCNIWDMAGNTIEWTTEYSTMPGGSLTGRGGIYRDSDYYTIIRAGTALSYTDDGHTFRPILYL